MRFNRHINLFLELSFTPPDGQKSFLRCICHWFRYSLVSVLLFLCLLPCFPNLLSLLQHTGRQHVPSKLCCLSTRCHIQLPLFAWRSYRLSVVLQDTSYQLFEWHCLIYLQPFLGTFTKLRTATISFVMCVRLSACDNLVSTKLDIWFLFRKFVMKF
jgi:hypothetical protein